LDIKDIFRTGEVVETDPENCLVRVKFPDTDELVSGWLQVVQQQTLKNKHYYMPDIEELVVCIFLGNGPIAGFVLGAIYNKIDTLPYNGQDTYYTEYNDKTLLQYDRKTHEATANIKGNVSVTVDGNNGGEESDKADGTVDITVKDAIKITGKSLTVIFEDEKTLECTDIIIKASNDMSIKIGGNCSMTVTGNIDVESNGNIDIKSTGNAVIESTGNMDLKSVGNMTVSPTAVLTIGKLTPAASATGPLNCLPICLFAGPPHGGNTVA